MIMPDRATRFFLVLLLILVPFAAFAQEEMIPHDAAPEKAPDPVFIVGEPAGPPISGEALETRTAETASLLRCPVCQGLSINDSPATMARNMKRQTRDLLAQGYSGEQVLEYFEKAYGEFVRLEPPRRGVNWLVWLSPLAVLIVGFFIVRGVIGKMSATTDEAPGTTAVEIVDRDHLPEDDELARYVLLARELAYGWPGGVSPEGRQEGE